MKKTIYTSFNLYFILPMLLWWVLAYPYTDPKYLQYCFAAVNTHYNAFLDFIFYYTTFLGEGITITVLLLLLLFIRSLRNWWYFWTGLLTNVLPTLLTQILKNTSAAPRPLKYFGDPAWVHVNESWPKLYANSFPSGHTTGAFSLFCFLAMLLPKGYRVWGIVFFLLALMVAYSRLYLAAHFLYDVYYGSLIGGAGSLLIFAIMNQFKSKFKFY